MATVLITGGTGLIGTALTKLLLSKGYEVIVLTRSVKKSAQQGLSFANWDVENQQIDNTAIQKADYIIHLAGANVAEKRWTAKRKQEILESRTHSAALILKGLQQTDNKVKAIISASAIGWYGPDSFLPGKEKFTETDPPFDDFLGNTCLAWENALQPAKQMGKRLVFLRTGIVLSKEGGALEEFRKPLKFGFATILGNGKQIVSWIHIQDVCRMYLYALESNIDGVFNAVAPRPVTNKELVLQLGRTMRGNSFMSFHVPSFLLKMVLGEMSIEVLKSTTVSSGKIQDAGFQFAFPSLSAALNNLCEKNNK